MNYISTMTLVGWETRNWRHREKALLWCKDYGLKPLTRHVFMGELYAKEKREMQAKFSGLFIGKTEKFFFVTMCKSCFNENMKAMKLSEEIRGAKGFELVQMPE